MESKVNIAAINYHFGSKDALLEKALEVGSASAFQKGISMLLNPGRDPIERLKQFFSVYARGMMKHPLLARTAFLSFLTNDTGTNPYGRYTKEMIEKVGRVIAEANGWTDGKESRTMALMVVSGVIFPFLAASMIQQTNTVDYNDDAARSRYVELLLTLATTKREVSDG